MAALGHFSMCVQKLFAVCRALSPSTLILFSHTFRKNRTILVPIDRLRHNAAFA